MASSDEYKRQIMQDLARGNVDTLNDTPPPVMDSYENFDDFTQRSTRDQRNQLFSRSLNHESIPPQQLEPELRKAINQIQPNERDDVARELFKNLGKRGLNDRQLEQQLGLSTHNPNRMSADDVTRLASFTYHNHPDIFREVLADKPALLKFFSNPIVAGILGIVAAKWLSDRRH